MTAVAAMAVASAVPGVAQARIELDRGIGGVHVGMTKQAVRAILGKPDVVERSTTPDNKPFVAYRYRHHHIRVLFFAKATAVEVITTSRLERLTNGVGVGTSVAALRRQVAHLHRQTSDGLSYVHRTGSGGRFTLFAIIHGLVAQVDVGNG